MYTAILVDDENKATKLLNSIINEFCPEVKVIGTANTAIDSFKLINEKKPDIVFLDIEMPNLNGFDLIELLPDRTFDVIFITAYNQYAITAFKVNAVDYILKPVQISEILEAVNKIIKKRQSNTNTTSNIEAVLKQFINKGYDKIAVASNNNIELVEQNNIIYLEADGGYTTINLLNRKVLNSKNIKRYCDVLNPKKFLRVHNSFVINLDHVKKYSFKDGGVVEMSNGIEIPVSRSNKESFLEAMAELAKSI